MTYRDLFHWLGAGAEQAWLECLDLLPVPTIDDSEGIDE